MLTGSGITVKAASDVVNKKFSEQIGILYSGMELGNLTIYGDENDLMAALPELTTKCLRFIMQRICRSRLQIPR